MLSLTTNNWYTMKLVIGDDLGNSALQRLRFWVDTDDDGDWSDETALLDSTAIDDEWSAGSIGFYRGGAAAQQYDTFRAGYDNNADLDIDDGGDDVLVSDDFATSVVSPTYDNNGNNTGDGVFSYTFDGWNRRRLTKLGAEGDALTVQEFAWYPTGRMATRANTNLGVENIAKDGGNITVRHYFAGRTLVEERNGSAQATRQYMWSSGQLVWMDTNGDPSIGNDANPDLSDTGEGSESPADKRHFYTYNAQHRIVALTDYTSGGGGNNGRIAERVVRGAHGGKIVVGGDSGSGETGSGRPTSNIGSGQGEGIDVLDIPYNCQAHFNPHTGRLWECLPDTDTGPGDDDKGGGGGGGGGDCVEGEIQSTAQCERCYGPCPSGFRYKLYMGSCVCTIDPPPPGSCSSEFAPGVQGDSPFPNRAACLRQRCPAGFSPSCTTWIEPGQPPITTTVGSCSRCSGDCQIGASCRKRFRDYVSHEPGTNGVRFIEDYCDCFNTHPPGGGGLDPEPV